ncbi:DUF4825 domain-containing protein [Sporosarcina sp. 179-K 8C2 HS]|uniref:DUF4825 domain-containing protein n=1 Tax=Sporosarcina sp. 179-K 8C2 HS TaxID=3142387 RepID=UPI0039A26F0A
MEKRRLIIGLIAILAIPLYIWIAYVEIPGKAKVGEEKLQQDPLKHDFGTVLDYKNDYMGDASNTSGLFQSLPLNEYKGTIEMKPEEFYLLVHYEAKSAELEGKAEQAVIYNSTAAFLLINNLEKVNMAFLDESYVVTRENVMDWFGEDFGSLIDPEQFKGQVQKELRNSGKAEIEAWLNAYMKGEDR